MRSTANGCSNKRAFPSAGAAVNYLESDIARNRGIRPNDFEDYRCENCKQWHVRSKDGLSRNR